MIALGVLLALAPLAAAPPPAAGARAGAQVVGEWTLLGQPFAAFSSNGACVIEGAPCTWRVKGGTLFITGADPDGGETEAVPFTATRTTLTVTVNGVPVQLVKAGAAAPPPAAPSSAAPAAPGPGAAAARGAGGDLQDPLAQLLLSSPWCHFWFNKVSGYSGNERVQYFADGTYQLGKKSEGYSSGAGGTFASEGRSGASGRWSVTKGTLHVTPPPSDADPNPQTFYPLRLVVKQNSNGAPIIVAEGKEYSRCE